MDVNTNLQRMYDRRDAIVRMARNGAQRATAEDDKIYREDTYRLDAITLLRPFFNDLPTAIDYVVNLGTEFVSIEEYVRRITNDAGHARTFVIIRDLLGQGIW